VLRQAWKRLAHKQWLIFYPLALAIINSLAFLAVYSSAGGDLHLTKFFAANFERWPFVRDHFFGGFAFTPALGIAVFVGLTVCVFTAMTRAPLFRAIAGPGYPLAPRSWEEAGKLSIFYVFFYLVVLVLPLAGPTGTAAEQVIAVVALAIALLCVYTDYAIVFEGLTLIPALRRSVALVFRRWRPVLVIFVILQFVVLGLNRLYGLYYDGAEGVFLLIPLSEVLVWSAVTLIVDVVLIFLYEQVRNSNS
jgi:hypothetical protein